MPPPPAAAEALVAAVQAAAGGGGTVVDLYSGVGLLGGAVADRWGARQLVAVESHRPAGDDAAANLADLGARVVRADAADGRWATGLGPDVVIADPARPGLGRAAVSVVAGLAAPVVVLVSCDPASLGRDARLLVDSGYDLDGVEVLDLFPQTFHLEAVSRFVRRR